MAGSDAGFLAEQAQQAAVVAATSYTPQSELPRCELRTLALLCSNADTPSQALFNHVEQSTAQHMQHTMLYLLCKQLLVDNMLHCKVISRPILGLSYHLSCVWTQPPCEPLCAYLQLCRDFPFALHSGLLVPQPAL